MQVLQKVMALSLSLILAGQCALFAAPAPQEQQSLAQLQQQANREIKENSWLTDTGLYILGAGGVTAVLLIAQHTIYNRKMIHLTRQYQEYLNQFSHMYVENAELRMKNASLRWSEMIAQENKWGLTGGQSAVQAAYLRRIQELENSVAVLENSVGRNAFYHELFFAAGDQLEKEMQPYHRLYDPSISSSERKALMKQLQEQPWFCSWPAEQQKEFLNIIEQTAATARKGENGLIHAAPSFFGTLNKSIPYHQRLVALTRGLFRSRTLGIIGVGVALFLMTPNTKAQNMAQRVSENPSLFLTASPEDLKRLEQNKETKEVCINIANSIHVLSQLSEVEASPFAQQIQQQRRSHSIRRNRSSRLAH